VWNVHGLYRGSCARVHCRLTFVDGRRISQQFRVHIPSLIGRSFVRQVPPAIEPECAARCNRRSQPSRALARVGSVVARWDRHIWATSRPPRNRNAVSTSASRTNPAANTQPNFQLSARSLGSNVRRPKCRRHCRNVESLRSRRKHRTRYVIGGCTFAQIVVVREASGWGLFPRSGEPRSRRAAHLVRVS
jgi:hypothetical protein